MKITNAISSLEIAGIELPGIAFWIIAGIVTVLLLLLTVLCILKIIAAFRGQKPKKEKNADKSKAPAEKAPKEGKPKVRKKKQEAPVLFSAYASVSDSLEIKSENSQAAHATAPKKPAVSVDELYKKVMGEDEPSAANTESPKPEISEENIPSSAEELLPETVEPPLQEESNHPFDDVKSDDPAVTDFIPDTVSVSEASVSGEKSIPSDAELSEAVEVMAGRKGISLSQKKKSPKEKVGDIKNKKNTRRSQRKLKQKSAKLQIPKTVQQSIPYFAVYEEDGIIETKPGVFTKSYLLGDVNYRIAREDEQQDMFINYGQFLNGFETNARFQITINQKNINMEVFEHENMLPLEGDGMDELRMERNLMLKKKIMEGKNHLTKEKYLTVSIDAEDLEAARTTFIRLDNEIDANVRKIGHATATPISTVRRLEILHDIYNLGDEGYFGNNIVRVNREDGQLQYTFAEEKFRFDIMTRMGLTTKDMIAPPSFEFKGDYGKIGDTYFRALFIMKLPSFLYDDVLSELTKTDYNMITSLHYQPIDGEKTQKMVRSQITNINASLVDKQKKASKAGYSGDLISPELQDAAREASELLDDINSKNQKMFFVTFVIVHFADTKEQLDSDTKAIQTIGNRLVLHVKKLNQQQENGLNSVLPLAYNQLSIKRSLTTESAAVFMPFENQELYEPTGMYYGINASSHNILKLDRRSRPSGNGFILGKPGAGKSMSAKQEMMTVLLSSKDTVVVIDPEGEYYPMAKLLGGEVIRIAAGANVHINPFDIDLSVGAEGEDDPMAIKSDFIVSLCETIVGDRYGLAPAQRSIIDRCVKKAYEPYLDSYNPQTGKYDKRKLPTLVDFYHLLRQQSGYDAMQLADGLEIYITGSLNIFAHQTNVEYSNRFVVYDISGVGSTMKSMALLIILDNIWNRMVEGRRRKSFTWFFVDEIYLLFQNHASAEFLKNLYKRARKYYGIPTGITQNVSDILENDDARSIISNCEYVQILNQGPNDRTTLCNLLGISPTQERYVTDSNPGEGLIYDGKVIVPFINKLPKDTKQYWAMTTKPKEIKEREALLQQDAVPAN